MEKMKKIIISIIIGIMALVTFHTTANAKDYGRGEYTLGEGGLTFQDTISVDKARFDADNNMFCIEHKQKLRTGIFNTYRVEKMAELLGNVCWNESGHTSDHVDTTEWNAKLAYIISQTPSTTPGVGYSKEDIQKAIWRTIHTWMTEVGTYIGFDASVSSTECEPEVQLDRDAAAYAKSIKNINTQVAMEDHTDKSKIKVVSAERDGNNYIKIGPFNWTFDTPLTKIEAEGKGNMNICFYSSYTGKKEHFYEEANKIQSGNDFYIYLPMDVKTEKLSKLKGYANVEVRGGVIWLLTTDATAYQNLIIKEPKTGIQEISTSLEYDIPIKAKLKVIKVDKDNKKIKLPNVGFIFQHKETGTYVSGNAKGEKTYVKDKAKASIYKTGAKGKEKGQINLTDLAVGHYIAYEVTNPNYGYEIDPKDPEKEIIISNEGKDIPEWVITNKQKYVKLSGFVWIDRPYAKNSRTNDLYKDQKEVGTDGGILDQNDILLNGITVRLMDKEGNVIKNENKKSKNYNKPMKMKTAKLNRYQQDGHDGNGEYLFEDVLVDELKAGKYHIEFEYDGITYTNVPRYINLDNGSKAAEGQKVRNEFNDTFATIEGAGELTAVAKDKNGKEQHKLEYEEVDNGNAIQYKSGQNFMITASTDTKDKDVPNNETYLLNKHFEHGIEEIKYINLGLKEREQPDIGIEKDLNNVRLEVNGCGHTYYYSQRLQHPSGYNHEGGLFNVGVRWGSDYQKLAYKRAIYEADYNYTNSLDKSKELKVYLTYQIVMLNKTPQNLTTKINSLIDYYDSNYTLLHVGRKLNANGSVVDEIAHEQDTGFNSNGYKKEIIYNETEVTSKSKDNRESIYVEFALDRDAVIRILNDQVNLDNIVEVNSYSILKDNKSYAGIDMNSIPGNYGIREGVGEEKIREDDTSMAPGLKLETADARQMTGKVFLDGTSAELRTGEVREGSGIYENGENGIAGVGITLTDNTQGSGKVYNATTDSHGDFKIENYIPSQDYTLTYTWGDETYTVQNYKGTVYKNKERQNDKEWYKKDKDIRYSDAMDNYSERKSIDGEMQTITHDTETTITRMNATAPKMYIGVEYDSTTTASAGDKYTYLIENLDFGIVERARQRLDIVKRVKTLKATLTNGQVIANLEIDENGNMSGDFKNVTYMKPDPLTQPNNGFIRLELDNELIQGTTLEVGYEIKAINQSELDYLTSDFYHYGKGYGETNLATITPTAIIDYLDNSWSFNTEKNSAYGWEVKQKEDLAGLVAETVYNNEESTIDEKIILYTEYLKDKNIEPKQNESVMLYVSKILTTTDEISLNNETENIQIDRPGGSKPKAIPGNYVPGKGSQEDDDSMAETTIVTPATGEDQNYVIPIIIGTTALITLGVGVIIIKKKIL